MGRGFWVLGLVLAVTSVGKAQAGEGASFDRVRPILSRCVACHNADDASGDLDLTHREAALKGGESGAALKPGDPEGSKLYRLIAQRKMPPKKPLPEADAKAIREWIKAGAQWEATLTTSREQDDADSPRWAFRAIEATPTPEVRGRAWVADPIDAYILQSLEAKGLAPNPPADRHTWLRRVTYDLTGLPPTPEEVDAFERDQRPDAYGRVVDRLLESPRYGERWARHWLDLARFAESHGFEYDRLRDNAWPYRDYVIRSFNQDKPYAQFVREQVAGDVLEPVTSDGIIATGFLVAGPWDQAGSGQANLVGRAKVREDELEDIVGVVGQTFLGLTVQCARCHSHKFDPIPQRDYYRLKAVFEPVGHGDRSALPETERKRREDERRAIAAKLTSLEAKLSQIERSAREKVISGREDASTARRPQPVGLWTFEVDARDELGRMNGTLLGHAHVARGRLILPGNESYVRTAPLTFELKEKTLEVWVSPANLSQRGGSAMSVERGRGGPFDAVVFGEIQPGKWMAGSAFYNRTKDVDGPVESARPTDLVQVAIAYERDGLIRLYREGKPYGRPYRPSGPNSELQTYTKNESFLLFGLRHLGAANGYLQGEVEEARLYDRSLSEEEIRQSWKAGPEKVSSEEIENALDGPAKKRRVDLAREIAALRAKLERTTPDPVVYAAQPMQPTPPPTRLLNRGDVETPAEVVSAGGLSAIHQVSSDFSLAPDAPPAQRRIKLAEWLTDPANPLPARVLVNRIWHYHFGNGIVATPSDFGANGGRPTHPALLDRLAADFLASGGRFKPLHRRIVLSSTYRQSSGLNPKAVAVDADSRLLWRFPPRRIEGEAVLDAMQATTGRLNETMGGPGFRPFTVTVFNSSFYNLTDPDGPEFRRRTIYRIHVHSARSPLMESLDCPDPSVKMAKRTATVTPIQALALMNDSFVERQAHWFAERVKSEAGSDPARQVERAYLLAFGRRPSADELKEATRLVAHHPLHRLAWALLNSNEFLYLR